MNSEIELTILMPCLNEAETLAICINKAKTFLETSGVSGEILIADNGSTDGSQQIARENGARVVDVQERGYGSALRGGTAASRGKYVIMGDADDSYDFLHLMPFVEKLREGYELVMGNRFLGGIEKGAMPFLHRYLGNPVLSFLGRILYKNNIGDFHCGLRGYDREAILRLNLRTTGMEYASEMVVMASLNHLKVTEVPTTLKPDGRSHEPHLRTFRDGWRHLKFLLMYCPRWLFLYPGIFLFTVGVIGMCALMAGPLRIGAVTFDIHTMLFMGGFIILGIQTVLLKLMTDTHALNSGFTYVTEKDKAFLEKLSLEKCVFGGAFVFLLGLVLAVISMLSWSSAGYGNLDPQQTMRQVIPAWTLLISGIQLVSGGFFLGILKL